MKLITEQMVGKVIVASTPDSEFEVKETSELNFDELYELGLIEREEYLAQWKQWRYDNTLRVIRDLNKMLLEFPELKSEIQ